MTPPTARARESCRCRSYNQPEAGQDEAEVVLDVPSWAKSERKTICVDACIAPVILALWAARIWTLGCCCGHGGSHDRSVIVERFDREKAAAVIRATGDDAKVLAWELVEGDISAHAQQAEEIAHLRAQLAAVQALAKQWDDDAFYRNHETKYGRALRAALQEPLPTPDTG